MKRLRAIQRLDDQRGPNEHEEVSRRVTALAMNLWWTWNNDARRLLAGLEPALWEACGRNPLATLRRLTPERRETLESDATFLAHLASCERQLDAYLRTRTWFERQARSRRRRMLVAYFSAEYAIDDCLPIYSGGLGVLAGDHLKSASDLGVPLVAVGLLYRCGYCRQELRPDGSTRSIYPRYDFDELPVRDTGRRVAVPLGGRRVRAKIWWAQVGRVALYLLDTDVPENAARDRAITRVLYGGDTKTRIAQEIVLGVGGVLALQALGIRPTVWHVNEGHAAFCGLERLRQLVCGGGTLKRSVRAIRDSTVFTTHTPVPAGHDRFSSPLVRASFPELPGDLGVSHEDLMNLGRERPGDRGDPFCMTVLALHLSARRNGVSALHGHVSRDMWRSLFPEAAGVDDVPIGHVTNGVHAQTWLAPEAEALHAKHLRPRWLGAGPTNDWWKRADRIPARELWAVRNRLRARLVNEIRRRLEEQALRRGAGAEAWSTAQRTFDEDALTIGFARRFATYKRAPLIFHNPRRLAAIMNHPQRPVQIVFAGKAHPADAGGQACAQQVFQQAASPAFRGRVALLENYSMHLGRVLTSGCDVWLNNPLRPQEASGTSGMKPPLQGGLNCSILDGWWPEAFDGRNGWAIGGRTFKSRAAQDRYDAECIYDVLEHRIVPLFYRRGRDGVPKGWVEMMKRSMKTVCGHFGTHRMVGEYTTRYYVPAHEGR
jgi:starch phosphorylase